LALAGFPGTAGFFSKDEILVFAAHRGGFYWIFTIGGYVGALLTAFYAFRIIFRVFWGDPVPEARELEQGHLAHTEPENPLSGEKEDTDVGFPGPEHHIAERDWPMGLAMVVLAFLSIFGGALQIPGLDDVIDKFLHGAFLNSTLYERFPSIAADWEGLAVGGTVAVIGIAAAYFVYIRRPGTSAALIRRLHPIYALFVNKWYFDELIDLLVVRPASWFGRWGQQTFERVFVNGTLVGGTSGIVRAGSAAVRAAQSGFLRAYAALLVVGVVAIALYFLIESA
jgi:NADH-quinone oxidoreductase subunit L